ncbi:MAG: hypothetical protein K2M82_01290 [Lachnospiraceae bacterium]|nr:hypothetical protein [Lachnospiraceae bacterium]
MRKEYYQPETNYERNFLMIKRYCSNFGILLIPILLFMSVLASCYLNMASEETLESYIFKVADISFKLNLDLSSYSSIIFMVGLLTLAFFIYVFLYIFFTSKNTDNSIGPDTGLMMLHRVSQLITVASALLFAGMIVLTAVFIFGDIENFEWLQRLLGLGLEELRAYKLTISIAFVFLIAAAFFMVWFAQSQTVFVKSVRLCLYDSLPRNKGARTYGAFSVAIGMILMVVAAVFTFLYYCYRDTFSGFGINISNVFVLASLIKMYVRGLVPFIIGINAFVYASMVDDINTFGTLYNKFSVMESTR